MEQAMIAMSGGVDSSVAAGLMLQRGFRCIGATMELLTGCGISSNAASDAAAVADRLGIPHYVLDFCEAFEQSVIRDFIHSYESGLTPNPCVTCNRTLKFPLLLRQAQDLGCQYLVTGHYAQIRQNTETGRYLLYKAADRAKDQTYFLYALDQQILSHTLFPLGDLTKQQVRQIAETNHFAVVGKKDSQDICFIPDGDYLAFMQRYTGKAYPAGDFLDLQGNPVGRHCGAVGYTLGQRKGLGIALGEPVYVCSKDMEKNTVTVGPDNALYSNTLWAENCHWIPFEELTAPLRVSAKARSRMAEQPAWVYPEENGRIRVEFDVPQRAITPGQAVVLYDEDLVIGGGTITHANNK